MTRAEVIKTIRDLAAELKHPPNASEIEHYTDVKISTIRKHFESIEVARDAAGITEERELVPTEPINGEINIVREDIPSHTALLQNIFLTGNTNGGSLSEADIEQTDLYSPADYRVQFGSLENAFDIAADGAEGVYLGHAKIESYLRDKYVQCGRVPYPIDVYADGESPGKFALRFGSYDKALSAAGISDDLGYRTPSRVLLEALRRVDAGVAAVPTPIEVQAQSLWCPSAFIRRFGSWAAALIRAGYTQTEEQLLAYRDESVEDNERHQTLDTALDRLITRWEQISEVGYLAEDLHRLNDELGRPPRPIDIDLYGQYATETYLETFGAWDSVLEAANLELRDLAASEKQPLTQALLEQTLVDLTDWLGVEPCEQDIDHLTTLSSETYIAYFGSVDDALEESRINRDSFGTKLQTTISSDDTADLLSHSLTNPEFSTDLGQESGSISHEPVRYLEEAYGTSDPEFLSEYELQRTTEALERLPKKEEFEELSPLSVDFVTDHYNKYWRVAVHSATEGYDRHSNRDNTVDRIRSEALKTVARHISNDKSLHEIAEIDRSALLIAIANRNKSHLKEAMSEGLDGVEVSETPTSEDEVADDDVAEITADLTTLYDRHYDWWQKSPEGRAITEENLEGIELQHFETGREALIAAGLHHPPDLEQSKSPLSSEDLMMIIKTNLSSPVSEVTPAALKSLDTPSAAAIEQHFGSLEAAVTALQAQHKPRDRSPQYTKEELLDILRECGSLPDDPPRSKDIDEQTEVSAGTIQRRFGDLRSALVEAGYTLPEKWPQHRGSRRYSDERIVEEIRAVAAEVGWVPSITEFKERATISSSAVENHFDSWEAAKEAADVAQMSEEQLREMQSQDEVPPREALINELQQLHDQLGDTLTPADVISFGEYSEESYDAVFGSIRQGMREAGI